MSFPLTSDLLKQAIHIISTKGNYYFQYIRNIEGIHILLFVLTYIILWLNPILLVFLLYSFIASPNLNKTSFVRTCTTGNTWFAECKNLCRVPNFGHSAKTCFAERRTRQNMALGKEAFAECLALGKDLHSAKITSGDVLVCKHRTWQRARNFFKIFPRHTHTIWQQLDKFHDFQNSFAFYTIKKTTPTQVGGVAPWARWSKFRDSSWI